MTDKPIYQIKAESKGDLQMPSTGDLERQVVADLISNPEFIQDAQGIVSTEMFSVEAYRNAWGIIRDMNSKGESIDLASISPRINRKTIAELMSPKFGIGYGATTMSHCRALAEMATRRTMFVSGYELMRMAADETGDFDGLIAKPREIVEQTERGIKSGADNSTITQVLNELSETIEANQTGIVNGKRTRIPTGFPTLDKLTYSGFNPGNLVVLAARPSVGKTAVMLQMAITAARANFATGIFSLEMTNQELGQRLLFSTGLINPTEIARGQVNWERVEKANGEFGGLPLYLNDTDRNLDDICRNIALSHQRGKCDIAFVDYLGLITISGKNNNPYQAITEITRRLKQTAKQCRIPLVVLCQLNRNSEAENRMPELRDLRDSGSIEQDADIVLMLAREGNDLSSKDVNLMIRKNRQGRAGIIGIKLHANETFTKFVEGNN